jgi:hypothetical protein
LGFLFYAAMLLGVCAMPKKSNTANKEPSINKYNSKIQLINTTSIADAYA